MKGGTQTQGQWKANYYYLQGQAQLHLSAALLFRARNHCNWRVALQCKPNYANKVLHRPPAFLRIPVCVRLLQSRADAGSDQGVLPDKIQDDFAVCARLS